MSEQILPSGRNVRVRLSNYLVVFRTSSGRSLSALHLPSRSYILRFLLLRFLGFRCSTNRRFKTLSSSGFLPGRG